LQKEIDKGNVTAGLAPVGWVSLGPYKYDNYVRGGVFKVVRFDQYWEKDASGQAMPYLDAVTNTPIPDRAVALGAFRAGRLDAMSRGVGTSLDPQEVTIVKKTFGDRVWFHRYPYLAYGVSMNVLKPPYDDIRVRKAVQLYMDRDEGAAKMQGGYAFSTGFLSPASWWHSHQYFEWPGFNPKTKKEDQAEALRIFGETGLKGSPVSITCRQDYLYMCEFIDSTLAQIGFKPAIELVDVNIATERSESLQFQTLAGGVCSDLKPIQCMQGYVTTAIVNRYNDPKIDEWQNIILTSTDPLVRRQALWDAEKYFLLEKAYNAPFWREEVVAPYRTYLKGSIVPGNRAHSNSDRATDWVDKSLM
jgi:peptide/nickel transport system substrate-binding protein